MNFLLLECSENIVDLSIESFIAFSLWKYLKAESEIEVKVIKNNSLAPLIHTNIGTNSFKCYDGNVNKKLPMLLIENQNYNIVGLCSVLRGICRVIQGSEQLQQQKEFATKLLGFKGNCLLSPSEVSPWVHFCEREIIACIKNILTSHEISFPVEIMKLECELSNPMRMHNIYKVVRETKNNQTIQSASASKVDLEHIYCHGNEPSLSDFMLFVIFKLIFMSTTIENNEIPLVIKWFRNMENEMKSFNELLTMLLTNAFLPRSNVLFVGNVPVIQPNGKYFSLFKNQLGSSTKSKKRNKAFTDQCTIDDVLLKLKAINIDISSLPGDSNQEEIDDTFLDELLTAGEMPVDRFERKKSQLKSLANEVLKISRDNDTIVDFCSGTGHLGLFIAHIFPNCHVIVLENKEESIRRAKLKAKQMRLFNVSFYQCNLVSLSYFDLFQWKFIIFSFCVYRNISTKNSQLALRFTHVALLQI
jgi:Methyltransferase domain